MKTKAKAASKLKQRARTTGATQWERQPVVITTQPVMSKSVDVVTPVAHLVEVVGAFQIRETLKTDDQLKFVWTGKNWVTCVHTRKMYNRAFSVICKAAEAESLTVDDNRSAWIETSAYLVLDLFADQAGQLYLRAAGLTFHFRDILKDENGKFDYAEKHWECNPVALHQIMPLATTEGITVLGTFNYDGSWTDVLVKSGYKKTTVQSEMVLEDKAEAWAAM